MLAVITFLMTCMTPASSYALDFHSFFKNTLQQARELRGQKSSPAPNTIRSHQNIEHFLAIAKIATSKGLMQVRVSGVTNGTFRLIAGTRSLTISNTWSSIMVIDGKPFAIANESDLKKLKRYIKKKWRTTSSLQSPLLSVAYATPGNVSPLDVAEFYIDIISETFRILYRKLNGNATKQRELERQFQKCAPKISQSLHQMLQKYCDKLPTKTSVRKGKYLAAIRNATKIKSLPLNCGSVTRQFSKFFGHIVQVNSYTNVKSLKTSDSNRNKEYCNQFNDYLLKTAPRTRREILEEIKGVR